MYIKISLTYTISNPARRGGRTSCRCSWQCVRGQNINLGRNTHWIKSIFTLYFHPRCGKTSEPNSYISYISFNFSLSVCSRQVISMYTFVSRWWRLLRCWQSWVWFLQELQESLMMLVMMMTTPRIIRPNDDNADNDSRWQRCGDSWYFREPSRCLGQCGRGGYYWYNVNFFELKSFD